MTGDQDNDVPAVIYHYCTVHAFRGILTSKQLCASGGREKYLAGGSA